MVFVSFFCGGCGGEQRTNWGGSPTPHFSRGYVPADIIADTEIHVHNVLPRALQTTSIIVIPTPRNSSSLNVRLSFVPVNITFALVLLILKIFIFNSLL